MKIFLYLMGILLFITATLLIPLSIWGFYTFIDGLEDGYRESMKGAYIFASMILIIGMYMECNSIAEKLK